MQGGGRKKEFTQERKGDRRNGWSQPCISCLALEAVVVESICYTEMFLRNQQGMCYSVTNKTSFCFLFSCGLVDDGGWFSCVLFTHCCLAVFEQPITLHRLTFNSI